MPGISRRVALGALTVGAVGAVAGAALSVSQPDQTQDPPVKPGDPPVGDNAITVENRLPGSDSWRVEVGDTHLVTDRNGQIQGYASATSVNVGDAIDFHITTNPGIDFTVAIHRLGYYGGVGARHLVTSPTLHGIHQRPPTLDTGTGLVSCEWPAAWRLPVPTTWVSGVYLAVFTTTSGYRAYTPFVVRDDQHSADLCVILPFSTYQAYNCWPRDGAIGKSLYRGEAPKGAPVTVQRAVKVSFDRPYGDSGLPTLFDVDEAFVQWVEKTGYNVTYATSVDLHAGRVDPSRFAGLVFPGHDEYWSSAMRNVVAQAVSHGKSLVFTAANNIHWHIRFESSVDGRADRVVVCYKDNPDPAPGPDGTTARWRAPKPGPDNAEQRLLGVEYVAAVRGSAPLIVRYAAHWFWAGCGVRDGDRIAKLVAGEADNFNLSAPLPAHRKQALLSSSPFVTTGNTRRTQNTSLYETPQGAVVFVAGTFNWNFGLSREHYLDRRIQTSTVNLFHRILNHPQPQRDRFTLE